MFVEEAEIEEQLAANRLLARLVVLNAVLLREVCDVLIKQLFRVLGWLMLIATPGCGNPIQVQRDVRPPPPYTVARLRS